MADDVQPDEGQGTEAPGSQFDSYLSTVPDGSREAAEAWFKDTSKSLNEKLDEAAEIKKTWEPYEPVKDSLSAYTPEQLNQLFSWHQHVTSSDDAWNEWFGQEAKNAGYTKAEVDALEDAEEAGDLSKEDIQKLIEEKAAEKVGPIAEQLTELQNERQISALEQDIRGRMTELEKEHDQKFTEDQKAVIFDLGKDAPDDADWVKIGYDRYMAIVAAGQKDFVDGKAKMPGSPMKGGGGEERLKSPTDIKEVEAQARERMRQVMQS
jgi:hypothetical protein